MPPWWWQPISPPSPFRKRWKPARRYSTGVSLLLDKHPEQIGIRSGRRQPHLHNRSDPRRRADAHAPAMQFDQGFCDREPQSRAVMGLGELAFDLFERPP